MGGTIAAAATSAAVPSRAVLLVRATSSRTHGRRCRRAGGAAAPARSQLERGNERGAIALSADATGVDGAGGIADGPVDGS
jgi:hypothetical protein